MANDWFSFKQFTVRQAKTAFKVTTDSVLLGAWADLEGAMRVLDIGTGTGMLALMAAQRCQAQITGVEPDGPSFEEAQTNTLNSPWTSRIKVVNIAIQDYIPDDSIPFDTVITNPPFFSRSLKNPDPRKALARHDFSLKPEELLRAAGRLLKEEGTLQLVLPVSEGFYFMKRAENQGFYCRRILRVKPRPASAPIRLLMTLGRTGGNVTDETLVIEEGGRHEYTREYKTLTGDFYLNF